MVGASFVHKEERNTLPTIPRDALVSFCSPAKDDSTVMRNNGRCEENVSMWARSAGVFVSVGGSLCGVGDCNNS